jgi:hypothetical protein
VEATSDWSGLKCMLSVERLGVAKKLVQCSFCYVDSLPIEKEEYRLVACVLLLCLAVSYCMVAREPGIVVYSLE